MMSFTLLFVVSALGSELGIKSSFLDFLATYKAESYSTREEYDKRYEIFRQNYLFIQDHNSQHSSVTLGVNKFADLTLDEFAEKYLSKMSFITASGQNVISRRLGDIPNSWDWETQGKVTPVIEQPDGISSVPLVITKAVESIHAIVTESSVTELSYTQLVDCVGPYRNFDTYLKYLVYVGGLMNATAYPNTNSIGSCTFQKDEITQSVINYIQVPMGNQELLRHYVYASTIATGIDAYSSLFQFYWKGVITGNCGSDINHAVLIVGYGAQGAEEYWKVQNTWGTEWGMNGYAKILRNEGTKQTGECGIAVMPFMLF